MDQLDQRGSISVYRIEDRARQVIAYRVVKILLDKEKGSVRVDMVVWIPGFESEKN